MELLKGDKTPRASQREERRDGRKQDEGDRDKQEGDRDKQERDRDKRQDKGKGGEEDGRTRVLCRRVGPRPVFFSSSLSLLGYILKGRRRPNSKYSLNV